MIIEKSLVPTIETSGHFRQCVARHGMKEEGEARSGVGRVPLAVPEVHNNRVEEGVGEWLLFKKADRKINQTFEEEEWQMEGDE